MSAAELLKKMQKVREERALRASNATEQAVKVESTRSSETEKQEQERRTLHNEQILTKSQNETETVSCQTNNNNQKQKISEETLLIKKTGHLSNTLPKKIDEEEDLMLNVPPSFTSPAHAIPQYRNRTSDPLCTPFHADLAANMFLHELICQNVDAGALQQNANSVINSVEHKNDGGSGGGDARQTGTVNLTFNNINSKQLPLLSSLNRKRARTCEQEQDDQMQQPAHNIHVNHTNTSLQYTTHVFNTNAIDCKRISDFSSCSMSSTSSSIAANYFSPYLTHKLKIVHHITSPIECTSSKFSLREPQRHLHSQLDNNNDNNYNFYEQRQSQVCLEQQEETVIQEGTEKNVCKENEWNTGARNQEQKQHEIKQLECKSLEKNLQSDVNNSDHKLPWMSLYEDSNYIRDCQRASIHTHNLHSYPCGDVNRYVRKDFIAHGVYGVVFSASKKVLEPNKRQNDESVPEQKANSFSPDYYVTNNNANNTLTKITNFTDKTTHQKDHMELFAVKQIRKSRLAESREGFPTYLLREFDLLLRVRHPNIVEAQELVLLDPSPQLNLCHYCKTHKEKRVDANKEATCEKLLEEQEEEELEEKEKKELHHLKEKEEEENEDEKGKESQAKNANSTVNVAEAATTDVNKSKEAVTSTNVVQTSSTSTSNSFQSLHHSSTKVRDVFLIMEYCPFDLKRYMFYYARNANPHLPPTPFLHISSHNHHPNATNALISRIKCVIYQILSGLQFLHDHRILHRDLKTSNILLDRHGRIKLCDFGLARHYREGQRLTPTVVTLLYRAPERHFGVMDYSHKLDSWSAGCIFAELFLKEPLFKAETDMGHLRSICDIIGIPSEESFPGLYKLPAAKEMMRSIGRWNRKNKLAQIFATSSCRDAALLPPSALDLLNKLLEWNPAKRLSAKEALEHAFFSEFPPPCAPSELMTPMPTLYSSSNQKSATEQIESKTNELMSASASTCVSLSTFAKNKHNANADSGDSSSKTNHIEMDNNTLTHPTTTTTTATANTKADKPQLLTSTNINHITCNNNVEEPSLYADNGKTFAEYNVKKYNKTAVEMETDEENDMYCSPVDTVHEDSSRNASNSLKVNSVLYATNNYSDNTDLDSTNYKRHNDADDDDGDVTGIHQVKNICCVS